jgi:hypothetical protein
VFSHQKQKDFTPEQKAFGSIFYWAAYFGSVDEKDTGKQLVDIFMGDFGFNPFIGFYRDQSPVFGTIKQKNFEMFQYLVKDTRYGLPPVYTLGGDDQEDNSKPNKYYFDEKNKE